MKRLFLLLVLPAFLHAARPPEWLVLPNAAEPRPAGASAWILEDSVRYAQTEGEAMDVRTRRAVMPLSEAGVQGARCFVPFVAGTEKVVSAHAWAFSPDGRKCREFTIDEFSISSLNVNSMIWDQEKTVYFEARRYLQPGWIFAYEVEIRSTYGAFDLSWSPRQTSPIKHCAAEFDPAPGGAVRWKAFSPDMPDPSPGSRAGSLQWTLTNVPSYDPTLPREAEPNTLDLRAEFVAPHENAGLSESWSKVAGLARGEIDPKAVTAPEIESRAKQLAGSGDLWTRIEPVCRFVGQEITYLGVNIDCDSKSGMRPHLPAEVYTNRYGDCKDKALLLCTMLRALGVEARVALVSSGAPMRTRSDWPSVQFNHAIVAIVCREAPPAHWPIVQAGTKTYVLFDPTADWVPLGLLPESDIGGQTLILDDGVDRSVTITPGDYAGDQIASKVDLRLLANGSAQVTAVENWSGLAAADAAMYDRSRSLPERTEALESRVQRWTPLIANLTWTSSADPSSRQWNRNVQFLARYLIKPVPGGSYVSADLFSEIPHYEPWDGPEDGWCTIRPKAARREITFSAPPGWQFSEVPPDWSGQTTAGEASLHYVLQDGVVVGTSELRIAGGVLNRDGYRALCNFLVTAQTAEHRPLMLKRLPAVPVKS